MAVYKLHLRTASTIEPDDIGVDFRDLHHAYLEACKAIPDLARDMLVEGQDPLACSLLICDEADRQLIEVLFSEVLSPAKWRLPHPAKVSHGLTRSSLDRDNAALSGFRRTFADANVGCVLLTPDLRVVEMNQFGARHGHVDSEVIRGSSILDIFDLSETSKPHYERFMRFAQIGLFSEISDLPYLMLNDEGETIKGWWSARTWPIYDDDQRLAGIAEWAEPSATPLNHGSTEVRLARLRL